MKIALEFKSEDEVLIENEVLSILNIFFKDRYSVLNVTFPDEITLDTIENAVCDHVKCKPQDLQIKTRKREVVLGRQLCHHISKISNIGTLSSIGFRFGKMDHATVLHSSRTILNMLETSREFRELHQTFIESFK